MGMEADLRSMVSMVEGSLDTCKHQWDEASQLSTEFSLECNAQETDQ